MSAYTPTVPHASVEERLARLEAMTTTVVPPVAAQAMVKIPTWLGVINVGTLLAVFLAIIGFAFYLGGTVRQLRQLRISTSSTQQ